MKENPGAAARPLRLGLERGLGDGREDCDLEADDMTLGIPHPSRPRVLSSGHPRQRLALPSTATCAEYASKIARML